MRWRNVRLVLVAVLIAAAFWTGRQVSASAPIPAQSPTADCLWGVSILATDVTLDRQTAGAATDPALATYYNRMAGGLEQARLLLTAACEGSKVDRGACATTLAVIVEGADSHSWYLANPEGVSASDLQWHQTWLANYDRLAGLFMRFCPKPTPPISR